MLSTVRRVVCLFSEHLCVNRIVKSGLKLKDVFIVAAARTPVGSFGRSLAPLAATRLGSIAIRGVLERSGIDPNAMEGVYMGQVCQAGAGQDPARQAAIGAGLSNSTPTFTVNKVCASGMKSIMLAAQNLQTAQRRIMIAGGQESMSQVPFYLNRRKPSYGGEKLIDGIVQDGLWDAYNDLHMGACAEVTATRMAIGREEQDEYCLRSYKLSQAAAKNGVFEKEIVPVHFTAGKGSRRTEHVVTVDEEPGQVDFGKVKTLKTVFQPDGGTVTAANASSLNDGAAAALLMTEEAMLEWNVKPLARIVGFTDAACAPIDYPIAPTVAVPDLLKLCGLTVSQISAWEINEAFSVVVLACNKVLGLNPDLVNVHGGAVSIGHPIGMSGARITNSLALRLKKGQFGVAAICNGGGGASAICLEGLN